MARPRIFISSTFFDLRQIRADLERFIKQIGYEPVLNERGRVPYGSDKKLEEYCYREIELCDILVAIVGGRYGSASHHQPYSISQMELKTAIEKDKQVFIFVETSVYSEYSTYQKNKENGKVQYSFVDDPAIFRFLEEIMALPNNNPISTFETADEITDYLKEQWAGLFQRYLQGESRVKEVSLVESMASTAQTLNQLVTFLTDERKNKDQAIRDILGRDHPIFKRLQKLLQVRYRLFFTTRDELKLWLKARSYTPIDKDRWDSPDYEEWINSKEGNETYQLLKIATKVFDSKGNLKLFTADEWKDKWISVEERQEGTDEPVSDETPF